MYILGLTGGMASGKTTVAGFLKACGAAIVDADKIVHDLQQAGTEETKIIADKLGKDVLNEEGGLSRPALAAAIQADKSVLTFLEDVLHPAVRREELNQLKAAAYTGHGVAILDIPLLFETDAHLLCDGVAVCHSPLEVRKERAFARPGMNEDKWKNLLARRWDDAKMLQHADFVIDTNTTLPETKEQVQSLYEHIIETLDAEFSADAAWPQKWAAM